MCPRTKDKGAFHRRVWISWPHEGPSASQAMLFHINLHWVTTVLSYSTVKSSYGDKISADARKSNMCRITFQYHGIPDYDAVQFEVYVLTIRKKGWFKFTWYTRVQPSSHLPQIMARRKYHDRKKLNLNLYKGQITEISVVSWPTKYTLYKSKLHLFLSFCMFRPQLVKLRVKILNINLVSFKNFKSILKINKIKWKYFNKIQ